MAERMIPSDFLVPTSHECYHIHCVAREVSNIVSDNANLVHARELDITEVTTVTELFELIDLPYRITKHAQLSVVTRSQFADTFGTPTLRLEWRGEGE
jgi:hypothetical protein